MNVDDLAVRLRQTYSADQERCLAALKLADQAHAGQRRLSGQPYITHILATARRLIDWGMDADTVIAGLLHDVPEDTKISLEEIEQRFGPTVRFLVSGVTKLGLLKYRGLDRYAENLRRMFVAMAEDVRVIIIKFADRLHNLETIGALPKAKQQRIAKESMEIFAPLADRLGMGEVRGEMEDLAFPILLPTEYKWLQSVLGPRYESLHKEIEAMATHLRQTLLEAKINCRDIHGRRKHLYSLYQKLIQPEHHRDIAHIYDVIALRAVVENETDCYAALGIVHQLWKPVPNRFKDYIAQPKPNGYRSLHTTVFGIHGQVVEIQIRSRQMHQESEYGVAAHWHYAQAGKPTHGGTVGKKFDWVKDLAAWKEQHSETLVQQLEHLKVETLQKHIFCFTPAGDVIDLPDHATVIDFAYLVHSDLGDHCVGARINDKMSSVDSELHSGDVVEILTDKRRRKPNPDWLSFVKTSTARSRIRRAEREE